MGTYGKKRSSPSFNMINKVGVSLGLPRRWVEQGSEYAVHIATAPGLEARRIDLPKLLTNSIKVRRKRKWAKKGIAFLQILRC